MEKIICETCNCTIAQAATYAEAKEIAIYEREANDNQGEVWECALCLDKRMREVFAEIEHDRPKIARQQAIDAQAASWDNYLERADMAYDRMRDDR